eukprot:gene8439-11416_t
MTHNEQRGSALREAQLALFTGSIYGATHTIIGHPLDTVKSKIQIQSGYANSSSLDVIKRIWKTEGFRGFYRGCIPPLWGSMLYRGIMMSSYEYSFTWLEKNCEGDWGTFVRNDLIFGIRPIVPISSVFAATLRGVLESPIEYAKVMGQTGKMWHINEIYRGFGFQILRTTALLIPIFTIVDIARQKTTLLTTFSGNFFVTAGASGLSYFICWPLETLKNLAQSGTPHPGATFAQRIEFLGGMRGLMRGIWPGTIAGSLRNGCGMIAMVYAQSWATKLGLR